MEDMVEPFPIEDFLASLTEVLKMQGDSRSIAILIAGECEFQQTGADWGLTIGLCGLVCPSTFSML